MESNIKGLVYGTAIGDAIGVPSEFMSREELQKTPITDMIGNFGVHNQPKGTWSDDTSLMLGMINALTFEPKNQITYSNLNLYSFYQGEFSIDGVFDIGITTSRVINKLIDNFDHVGRVLGETSKNSNGNGSLMRILPLAYYCKDMSIDETFAITETMSSITHANALSIYCCFFWVQFAKEYFKTKDFDHSLRQTKREVTEHIIVNGEDVFIDFPLFEEFVKSNETDMSEENNELYGSSGFVFTTLTSALIILKNAKTFKEVALKSANIGGDTDTIGAISCGLFGYVHGIESIDKQWVNDILGKDLLDEGIENFKFFKNNS